MNVNTINIIPGKNDIFGVAYIFPSYDGLVLLENDISVKLISATQKSSTAPLILVQGGNGFYSGFQIWVKSLSVKQSDT